MGSSRRAAATATASTVAAPVMSYFMPTMDAGGFSESPPESKVMPLPTSARCCVAPSASIATHLHQPRTADRTRPDAQDAAEPALAQRVLVEHLDREARGPGELARARAASVSG